MKVLLDTNIIIHREASSVVNDDIGILLKTNYVGFNKWFNGKSDEISYICELDEQIMAFLYLKVENENDNYSDIVPPFSKKRRLKVGTFKVTLNGYKIGERFIKIILDNASRFQVEEIYVTVFDKTMEQQRLIKLLEDYGFKPYGHKNTPSGTELVYTRDFSKKVSLENPKVTYPFVSAVKGGIFIVPIYPEYHTNLFPDSILKTESPENYVENEPFRNAISKVYISRSIERDLSPGDVIIFYRTGGYYKGVVTTIGVVESVVTDIKDEQHFINLCKKRSVFTDQELAKHWNYSKYRPFIVNFLYVSSFTKRPNLQRLIELGVISDIKSVPRGFTKISRKNFDDIIREAEVDESIIVN